MYFPLLFILLEVISRTSSFHLVIPNSAISFCSIRMNSTNKYGCKFSPKGRVGRVVLARTFLQLYQLFTGLVEHKIILVIPASLFVELDAMHRATKDSRIVGVIILRPSKQKKWLNVSYFSELSICKHVRYNLCFNKTNGVDDNILRSGYYFFLWPFPIILLKSGGNYQQNIIDCYENYNYIKEKGPQCELEITNYYPDDISYDKCFIKGKPNMRNWLAFNFMYCQPINGRNIYVTFNEQNYYQERSIILLLTKMDSISMFDTAAVGSDELYPNLGLMMYLSSVFKKSATDMKIPKNTDVLLVFTDNDSLNLMGSKRLIYDLKNGLITNSYTNISEKHIMMILLLGNLGYPLDNSIYLTYQCKEIKICSNLIGQLHVGLANKLFYLKVNDISHKYEKLKIWTDFNIPIFMLESNLISQNNFENSFFDMFQPNTTSYINELAFVLLHFVLNGLDEKYKNYTPNFKLFNVSEMAFCIYQSNCVKFIKLLGLNEKAYYNKFANGFVSQSFVHGTMNFKQESYKNRLSYFVLRLLIFYLSKSFKLNSDCEDFKNYQNFTTEIKDINYCFDTNIQVQTEFLIDLPNSKNSSFSDVWYRITPLVDSYLILKVSTDTEINTTIMVFATIITALCFVSSIFIYRNINSLVPLD